MSPTITCPQCYSDNLAVVQTNGSYCLIRGRREIGGVWLYNWVGMALGDDGTGPPYDDELQDLTSGEGHPILACMECRHRWPDADGVAS